MPFRPPLTTAQLLEIQSRHLLNGRFDEPDICTLLHAQKRDRAFYLLTYQLRGEFKRPTGILAPVFDDWDQWLMNEPCVRDWIELKTEVLYPSPPSGPRR